MSPEQRRRAVYTFFIVGGALYAFSSFESTGSTGIRVFGVLVGLIVAAYGFWQFRQVPRDDERRGPGDQP